MPKDYFGFDEMEQEAIKHLLIQGIERGATLEQIFPGDGPLAEEAALIYLILKNPNMKVLFGVRPQAPDPRDSLLGEMPTATEASVDLRPFCSPVESQGTLGSCSAQATVGAYELLAKKVGLPALDYSRLFQYYNTRVEEGTVATDSGAYLRTAVKVAKKYGICDETLWPYNIGQFAAQPPQGCYADAAARKVNQYLGLKKGDVQQLKNTLAYGYPVLFGMYCFPALTGVDIMKTGILTMPGDGEKDSGGHAVLAVGYDDAQRMFVVRNSWGKFWGRNGYFFMPYTFYQHFTFDPWTLSL